LLCFVATLSTGFSIDWQILLLFWSTAPTKPGKAHWCNQPNWRDKTAATLSSNDVRGLQTL
jgi:hypothetical protein